MYNKSMPMIHITYHTLSQHSIQYTHTAALQCAALLYGLYACGLYIWSLYIYTHAAALQCAPYLCMLCRNMSCREHVLQRSYLYVFMLIRIHVGMHACSFSAEHVLCMTCFCTACMRTCIYV